MIPSSSRRLKHSTFFFWRNVEKILKTNTAAVVVFIPPAVEPVEPPTTIRQIMRKMLPSLRAARSTVLKPAVLAVTDWNRDARIRSPRLIPS